MRKRMAILVIGIGAVLSSRESGQSFSKEMGAESFPKGWKAEWGQSAGTDARGGLDRDGKKENDNWSEDYVGGETFPVGPMRPKQESHGISSVDGFEPFSGGCRNGACTGEEVYILRLFYKVEGGGRRSFAGCRLNG